MGRWNRFLHPRGNRRNGNPGQFAQKQQAAPETTLSGMSPGARSIARMLVEDDFQISSRDYDTEAIVEECFEERDDHVGLKPAYREPGSLMAALPGFQRERHEKDPNRLSA
ncbi:hypothetical protein F8O07_06445 [Pseudoclavibacter sp. CFCC 13796]|uniref:hypothetical protein n=1 Tax=unclassified Pseudoclavibacter TaxID=2615177 RepID=UPI0013019064|nr:MULTISPECIES: hypothetical protein [unclassified Pseudoclavibacter]KAB1661541.1 hypothetical protein F8O07_06445 [Pseudoclavibacter sp. CFCC 13796]MCD7100579.1 hypothetical protein [Pseudoclavibacter sp. 13-3]